MSLRMMEIAVRAIRYDRENEYECHGRNDILILNNEFSNGDCRAWP